MSSEIYYDITTCDLLEGFQLVHGKKAHIRGAGKPCAIFIGGRASTILAFPFVMICRTAL